MSFTSEQQEAMARFCREWHKRHMKGFPTVECGNTLIEFANRCGIVSSTYQLSDWLEPYDSSEPVMRHPGAPKEEELMLLKRHDNHYRYQQWVPMRGMVQSGWHRTLEGARLDWNRLCRAGQ